VGSAGGRGRWGTPNLALHTRIQPEQTDNTMVVYESISDVNLSHKIYLLISFRKSTPPQTRQLVDYYY